jgi:hypothetical protein
MFDLDYNMAQWRKNQSVAQPIEAIDTIALRLRQEIDSLRKMSLSDEEAFHIARHRLGDREVLQSKADKGLSTSMWQTRLPWILGGFLVFTCMLMLVLMTSHVSTLVAREIGYGSASQVSVNNIAKVILIGVVLIGSLLILSASVRRWLKWLTRPADKLVEHSIFAALLLISTTFTLMAPTINIYWVLERLLISHHFRNVRSMDALLEQVWPVLIVIILCSLLISIRWLNLRRT